MDRREFLLSTGRLGALGIVASILAPKERALAFRSSIGFWASKESQGLFQWGTPISSSVIRPTSIDLGTEWAEIVVSSYSLINSSYGIKTDGTLWAWGDNKFGQLGLGHRSEVLSPTQIGSAKWKTIAISVRGVAGIQADGSLWAWGVSENGENGIFYDSPQQTPEEYRSGWKDIWADYYGTLAIKTDGSLWLWGGGTTGVQSPHLPTKISSEKWLKISGNRSSSLFLLALHENGSLWGLGYNADGVFGATFNQSTLAKINDGPWTDVVAGSGHVVAVKSDGSLWAWGRNNRGQLGDGTYVSKSSPVQVSYSGSLRALTSADERNFLLNDEGEIWGWGSNAFASLGVSYLSPTPVPSSHPWNKITGMNETTLAIATDGTLWGWGHSYHGALGVNSTHVLNQKLLSEEKWKDVSASNTVYGIQTNGTLWTWGWGSNGELGDGSQVSRTSPVQVSSDQWRSVSVGMYAAAAIKEDNTLWVAGANSWGTLGVGDLGHRSHLTQVGGQEWRSVDTAKGSTSAAHTLAIKTDGSLWAWGYNSNGQLGDGTSGTNNNKSSPIQVGSSTDWVKIQAGSSFSVALKSDNSLWRWGYLSLSSTSSPIQVPGEWIDISASRDTLLAKKVDGSIWGFGNNSCGAIGSESLYSNVSSSSGVLVHSAEPGLKMLCQSETSLILKSDGSLWGLGSNFSGNMGIEYNTPSKVIEGGGWKSIKAHLWKNIAVKSDGTLWFWGNTGQLGFANPNNVLRYPMQTRPETEWAKIEDLNDHIICFKTDGSRWTWGSGAHGELGNNSFSNGSSPIQLSGTGWSRVSTGANYSVAIKSDGTLWSWGNNANGGLAQHQAVPLLIDSGVWQDISLGYRCGAGIKSDGTLWSWGTEVNSSGILGGSQRTKGRQIAAGSYWTSVQVGGSFVAPLGFAQKSDLSLWVWGWGGGDGPQGINNSNRLSSPVQIPGEWKKVSVSESHVLALGTDGALWGWGRNSTLELGLALPTYQQLPILLSSEKWKTISATSLSSMAIRTDGTLWAWGSGLKGRTGTGYAVNLSSPTQIGSGKNWAEIALGYHCGIGLRKK